MQGWSLDFRVCGGGCSQAYSTVGYTVEIERCKAELRRTGTRCPTCDRRCRIDFGILGFGCGWFGQRFSRFVRFCGERLEFGIFGCGGGCSQACSTFGSVIEFGRCRTELRKTGTRCPSFVILWCKVRVSGI